MCWCHCHSLLGSRYCCANCSAVLAHMCWEGAVAHHCCQRIDHTQLLVIQLCCTLPRTGLQTHHNRCNSQPQSHPDPNPHTTNCWVHVMMAQEEGEGGACKACADRVMLSVLTTL